MTGRQTKRARRLARAEQVRAGAPVHADYDYGIFIEQIRPGGANDPRLRLRWDIAVETDLALMGIPRVLELVRELESELVLMHREMGDSWDDIGFYLELPGETVRRRHGGKAAS